MSGISDKWNEGCPLGSLGRFFGASISRALPRFMVAGSKSEPYIIKPMRSLRRTQARGDAPATRRDRAWESKYLRLRRLVLSDPESYNKPADEALIRWFKNQKKSFDAGTLRYQRAIRINELALLYSDSVNRWQRGFGRLLAFRNANPDRWPRQDEEFPRGFFLGKWCWRQISDFNHGILEQDRVRSLRKVGFPLDTGLRTERWFRQLRILEKFRQQNPDRWPYLTEFFPPSNRLGYWLWRQVKQYANGTLDKDKVKVLNRLGADWKLSRTKYQDQWKTWKSRLIDFRYRHPDRWPRKSAGNKEEKKVAEWCYLQRHWKKKGILSQERYRHLLEIGFPFEPRRSAWKQHVQELRAWRRTHPKTWPTGQSKNLEEKRLGDWVYTQRARKKAGKLSNDEIRILTRMGFQWRGKSRAD